MPAGRAKAPRWWGRLGSTAPGRGKAVEAGGQDFLATLERLRPAQRAPAEAALWRGAHLRQAGRNVNKTDAAARMSARRCQRIVKCGVTQIPPRITRGERGDAAGTQPRHDVADGQA